MLNDRTLNDLLFELRKGLRLFDIQWLPVVNEFSLHTSLLYHIEDGQIVITRFKAAENFDWIERYATLRPSQNPNGSELALLMKARGR